MQIVVNELLLSLIAGMGCLVGGTLLLPSLATDELRGVLADVIQICGMSISGYASRIFPPEQVHVVPHTMHVDTSSTFVMRTLCFASLYPCRDFQGISICRVLSQISGQTKGKRIKTN